MKSALAEVLRGYMIPSDVIVLDIFPLTPNGKIDRALLPAPSSLVDSRGVEGTAPKTKLAKDIADVWGEVLGLDRIFMSDNFFDLGGHSLMSVKLFAKIKKLTALDLPLAILFDSPTLKDLVEQIGREINLRSNYNNVAGGGREKISKSSQKNISKQATEPANRWDVIVPIRAEGSLPPLFLLHAVFGNILNYAALLPFLDKNRPVYALQAVGLDGLSKPYKDFNEMIDHYTIEVQRLQPHGPYLLAGLSLGGVLALELAHSLQQKKEHIEFLGMFDSLEPPIFAKSIPRSGHTEVKNIGSLPITKSKQPLNRAKGHKLPHPGILSRLPIDLPNNRFMSVFSHLANLSASYICIFAGKPRPGDLREWLMLYSHLTAIKSFKAKDYDVNITLFRSTTSNLDDRHDYGWGEYTKKEVEVIEIPAGHGNKFLESPDFAKALNTCLEQPKNTHNV